MPKTLQEKMKEFDEIVHGIDLDEVENEHGWWETSTGAEFGAKKKAEIKSFIESTVKEVLEGEREQTSHFLKNILDGIDKADEQMGNPTGGTLAIRIALISRGLLQLDKSNEK